MDKATIHPHDETFVKEKLRLLPRPFTKKVLREYGEIAIKKGRTASNLYLLDIEETVSEAIAHRLNKSSLNYDEDELKKYSELKAKKCIELWHLAKSKDPKNLASPYKKILRFIKKHGIEPSFLKKNPAENDHKSLIRRSTESSWWLRNLRKVQNRDIETMARALNFISKQKEIYASDMNVYRRKKQKEQQKDYLEKMFATNELGDQFKLSELKEKSVSDPYIRKSELMVRCRGFEDYAKQHGHISLFLTMTCPSKYHRAYRSSGDPSENWNGSTPIHAQEYLKRTWSRIRTSFDRSAISPYGFRVSEPHHDGTPHWHLLIFVEPENKTKLLGIMKRYCFEEDGDEKGALEHRFEIVEIDPNKGSATGYIAKYISKNIDGKDLDEGVYGENPIVAAQRVEAWASIWAIRQFQQIGGAQVCIWRELRRLDPLPETEVIMETARQAADSSDWSGYQEAMGGVICLRKDRPIKLIYKDNVDTSTGELHQNQYEEISSLKILGLKHNSTCVITRKHEWKISKSL